MHSHSEASSGVTPAFTSIIPPPPPPPSTTNTLVTPEATSNTLLVDIPIADGLADEFRMSLGAGSAMSPGRPSRTEITVLEHGHYRGQPVTKVLLRPISGRRHQLRLHTQAIGHAIVGDVTYGPPLVDGQEEAHRMMLHAYRLR